MVFFMCVVVGSGFRNYHWIDYMPESQPKTFDKTIQWFRTFVTT